MQEANKHDASAVAVMVAVSGSAFFKVGYLAREVAGIWCRLVDRHMVTGKFEEVTGGNDRRYGLNFRLQLAA